MPDPQIGNGHPDRIIVCSVMGDWIEWEKPGWPEPRDCPFSECDCTPTLFVRAHRRRPLPKPDPSWFESGTL